MDLILICLTIKLSQLSCRFNFEIKLRPEYKWKHELGSSLLVQKMIDDNYIDIEKEDTQMIQDLILANYQEKYKEHSKA
jgi:hypothetical protein